MMRNRSMPEDVVIPVLSYSSVTQAVDWLTAAFGFTRRWQVGDHRAQIAVGTRAAIAIVQGNPVASTADHLMVRVEDVTAHRNRAVAAGATVGDIGEHPYGERQYSATDFSGRAWVFTQSIAAVSAEQWGGNSG